MRSEEAQLVTGRKAVQIEFIEEGGEYCLTLLPF